MSSLGRRSHHTDTPNELVIMTTGIDDNTLGCPAPFSAAEGEDSEPVVLVEEIDPASAADALPGEAVRSPAATRRLDGPRLQSVRVNKLGMTQTRFALEIQAAARQLGYHDLNCSKRLVQKWEAGEHGMPIVPYQAALVLVTGESIDSFCRPAGVDDGKAALRRAPTPQAAPAPEDYSDETHAAFILPGTCGGSASVLKLDGRHLRAVRVEKLGLSQLQFAVAVQAAGRELGFDLKCTKRLVQKWESGEHAMPRPLYQKALAHLTGETMQTLCEPIFPADPDEAAQQLVAIVAGAATLYRRLIELHTYLSRRASPQREPFIDDDLIRQIHRLRAQGDCASTIAETLGIGEAIVKAHFDDVPPPEPKPVTRDLANEARILYREDRTLTVADLAEHYGVRRRELAQAICGETHRNSGTVPVYPLRPEPDPDTRRRPVPDSRVCRSDR